MRANTFNKAISKAKTERNHTTRLRIPHDGNVYCSAIYNGCDSTDVENRPLYQFEPVWLAYPPEVHSAGIKKDSALRAFRYDDPSVIFGQLAVSRTQVEPGKVGTFCVEGKTLARVVADKIKDHPIHFKEKWSIKLLSIGYDLEEDAGEPCFVFPIGDSFTPYYDEILSNVPNVGAKLLYRPIKNEIILLEVGIEKQTIGLGLIILPIYFHT